MSKVDLTNYKSELGLKHQLKRFIWQFTWLMFARFIPRRIANKWKILLLKIFGTKVEWTSVLYSSAKIYAPWNLVMKEYSCLAENVDCYNVDKIVIGAHSTVSQKSYLCTASHDITKSYNPLVTAPINIQDQCWVGAAVFIGPGVTLGKGSVVGATSSVYKSISPWLVVGGNPAKILKRRELFE